MPDLVVDLYGLTHLGAALDRIADRLDRARTELRGAFDDLGDDQVVEGLDRFEDRWRDGRKQLRENAETLSTMLTESVAAYRGVDEDLASGLTVR